MKLIHAFLVFIIFLTGCGGSSGGGNGSLELGPEFDGLSIEISQFNRNLTLDVNNQDHVKTMISAVIEDLVYVDPTPLAFNQQFDTRAPDESRVRQPLKLAYRAAINNSVNEDCVSGSAFGRLIGDAEPDSSAGSLNFTIDANNCVASYIDNDEIVNIRSLSSLNGDIEGSIAWMLADDQFTSLVSNQTGSTEFIASATISLNGDPSEYVANIYETVDNIITNINFSSDQIQVNTSFQYYYEEISKATEIVEGEIINSIEETIGGRATVTTLETLIYEQPEVYNEDNDYIDVSLNYPVGGSIQMITGGSTVVVEFDGDYYDYYVDGVYIDTDYTL